MRIRLSSVRKIHWVFPRGILALCVLTDVLTGVSTSSAQAPMRVVSVNLCADQLVLALADPAQIASLGPFARDPSLSFMARAAEKYPSHRGSAEEMIELKADLVLLGSFDSRYARAVLEHRKIPFMLLEPWRDLAQGAQQIRDVGQALGHPARGESLIAKIDEALVRLQKSLSPRPATALILHRRGYAMQSGVAADLLRLAGLHNAAADLGLAESGVLPMERIVAQPPDFLVVARQISTPADQGEAVLAHRALLRLFPAHKRLEMPDRLSICAGPSTPALIEKLAAEIAQKIR